MAIDRPRFIPLSAPPHRRRGEEEAVVRVMICGTVGSGKRTLAKAIVRPASPKLGLDSEHGRAITIRTRESVLEPSGKGGGSEATKGDYLVLVVDGTRAGDVAELSKILSVLPLNWWSHTAIVLTKFDMRSRAAFRPQQLTRLVSSYSPTIPVCFSSPSNLPTIAQRIRRLALSSSTGDLRPLQGLRVERPPRFLKADSEGDD